MPKLFKYVDPTWRGDTLKLAKNLAPNLEGSEVNVIEKYPWTLTPYNSPARTETPYIKLKEFYLTESYVNQLLKSYGLRPINSGSFAYDALGVLTDLGVLKGVDTSTQLYEGMYDHTNPTGFSYKFPYFENGQTNINNWTQKSTYDTIVYYQQKLAPYVIAQEIQNNMQGGPLNPTTGLTDAVLGYYSGLPQAAIDFFGTTDDTSLQSWLDWLAGGTSLALLGAAKAADPYGALDLYERATRTVTQVRRAAELIDIALKSPMASIDSDPVIDKPLIWSSSSPRSFVVAFPLFNTSLFGDFDAEQIITRNWELCYLLTYQNLFNKRNLYTGIPPVFYEIEIPGIHYTKAGYVNSLNIVNVGNTRKMKLPIGNSNESREVNVPDAYFVTMSLIDFFMPSRNFLETLNNSGARDRVKTSSTLDEITIRSDVPQGPPGTSGPIGTPTNPFNPGVIPPLFNLPQIQPRPND